MTLSAKRYLFVTWDGGGVVPTTLSVARALVARGHHVRVLADPTVAAEVEAAGCTFAPWTTAPHRTSREREQDLLRDYAFTNRMKYLADFMERFGATPGPRWVADVLADLDAHPSDVVVTDLMLPWGAVAAAARKLPVAVLSTTIYMIPTPGITPAGAGLQPATGPVGRLRDALIRALMGWIMRPLARALSAERARHGLGPDRDAYDTLRAADRILVLTSPAFDAASALAPANVKWVGSPVDDPDWAQPWTSPWAPDDPRPLVLVGLSSTYQAQEPLLRRLVDALRELPVRAIVTLGPTVHADDVPGAENVHVVHSAPHAALLPHTAVLVTHCGHGTVLKGLTAGVPMLCVPMGRDQDENAARVAQHGAGIRLKPTASAAELRTALRRLLAEPSFREAAQRLASAIARAEGQADAVAELEAIAARPTAA